MIYPTSDTRHLAHTKKSSIVLVGVNWLVTWPSKLLPPCRKPFYYYTEWPRTGHNGLWKGIIGGGVTFFVLLWHTIMWNLWYNFTGFWLNVFLRHCQNKIFKFWDIFAFHNKNSLLVDNWKSGWLTPAKVFKMDLFHK